MIVQNVSTCYGHPTIEGTDVEVFKIIGCLADDMSIEEISKYYNLTIYQVKEAIDWARSHLEKEYGKNQSLSQKCL